MTRRIDDVRLEVDEFRLLREVINHHSGISFGMEARAVVERKLRDRLTMLGFSSFGEYCQYLRSERGRAELDEATDLVTVNETYFFREDYQLRCFSGEVLPRLARDIGPKGRLSIWSAGCSTGEEAYTIAILTQDHPALAGFEVRVFGSDISRRCVGVARRGVYGPGSFRTTTADQKRQWFVERPDGLHVCDRIRGLVHFGQLNILEEERTRLLGRMDAIFCRNVLIYFDAHARRRAIDLFHERLQPGGVLMLGHSESLLNVSTAFELLHLREDLVYRKPSLNGLSGPRSDRT